MGWHMPDTIVGYSSTGPGLHADAVYSCKVGTELFSSLYGTTQLEASSHNVMNILSCVQEMPSR